MLLAILLISLLIYAWSMFSKYQSSQDELANIEDTAKFNEQFTNYDRDNVQGYELLSLVNKIIDYNKRKSNAEGATNDEKYTPITIRINFNGKNTDLTQDGNGNKLFTRDIYRQSSEESYINNSFKDILEFKDETEKRYGGSDSATKLAKSIGSIFLSIDKTTGTDADKNKIEAVKKYNSYVTNNSSKYDLSPNGYDKMNNNEKEIVYKYYEYVQFKRSIFESSSNELKYDNTSGRIDINIICISIWSNGRKYIKYL